MYLPGENNNQGLVLWNFKCVFLSLGRFCVIPIHPLCSGSTEYINCHSKALASVDQLVEYHSAKPKVAGLIPDHGTCLGSGP